MRKVFLGIIALMLLSSCSKVRVQEIPQKQKVTFGYRLYNEVAMTKAVSNDSIIDWIAEQLPTTISLRLTDANGTRYNITTGSEVELPTGIYTVTGKSAPSASAYIVGSDVFFSSARPTITINTSVEITYTQKSYIIQATYGGFGIVIDKKETASATFASSHGETGNIEFSQIGTAGITFVNGNLSTYSLNVTVNPVKTGDAQTTYTFKSEYSQTSITPTNGFYYILHPKGINSVDGGTFSYAIADFRAVDVE